MGGVEAGPAAIEEVDFEATVGEVLARTLVPAPVAPDTVQEDEPGSRTLQRIEPAEQQRQAITRRERFDSHRGTTAY
jgi:hypothetical protein